jgi:aryl-alcohol dehydrogenase-like predicted oxidoreductase
MNYRLLGQTGLRVLEIGLATWVLGTNIQGSSYGQTQPQLALETLEQALNFGCNLFLASDQYANSEILLGQVLQQHKTAATKPGVVVMTQHSCDCRAETPAAKQADLKQAVTRSLDRLQRDYIDVFLLQNYGLSFLIHNVVFETLRTLQQQGLIRYFGIAVNDPIEGIWAIEHGQVQVIEGVYNLLDQKVAETLLPLCRESNVGFLAREPLANGFLAGKNQALGGIPHPE